MRQPRAADFQEINRIKRQLDVDLPNLTSHSTQAEQKRCFRECHAKLAGQEEVSSTQLNQVYQRVRGEQAAPHNSPQWGGLHPQDPILQPRPGQSHFVAPKPGINCFFHRFNRNLLQLKATHSDDDAFRALLDGYIQFNQILQAFCSTEEGALKVFGREVALRELSLRMALVRDQPLKIINKQTEQLALVLLGHWQYFLNVWGNFDFSENHLVLDLLSDAVPVMREKYYELQTHAVSYIFQAYSGQYHAERNVVHFGLPGKITDINASLDRENRNPSTVEDNLARTLESAAAAMEKDQLPINLIQRTILSYPGIPSMAKAGLIEGMKQHFIDITDFNRAFETILNNPDIMQILNRHHNSTFDRIIGLHNSRPWQAAFLQLREMAFEKLQAQLRDLPGPTERVTLCKQALQMSIFNKHRSNFVITGAFWNTNHMNMIYELISEYEKAPKSEVEMTPCA